MGVDVDEIDFRILEELQGNARLSNTELAVRVGLSPSPCWNRVRNLEKQGVIEKYVTIFNQGALGLPDTAMVYVTLEHHDDGALRSFEAALATLPEVMEAYLLTGDSDYFIHGRSGEHRVIRALPAREALHDPRYQPHEDGVHAALLEAYVLGAPAAVDVARSQSAAVSAIGEGRLTIWCRAALYAPLTERWIVLLHAEREQHVAGAVSADGGVARRDEHHAPGNRRTRPRSGSPRGGHLVNRLKFPGGVVLP